jgi:WD40 repeat protein
LRACFHPDGHRVLTASLDGTCRLWELAGAAISAPKLHAPFSLDGSRYLLHSNQWLQVTDSLSKQAQTRLQVPPGLRDAALSDDGRFVLLQWDSGSAEHVTNSELLIFDAFGGTNYCRVPDFTNSLHNSVLSRQGRWLACHLRKLVRLYDLRRANPVPLAIPQPDVVAKIYFTPNESDLLILSGTQALLWDLESRKPRLTLPHPAAVGSASISPDEKLLATCCADEWFTVCSAYIWDLASGKACGRPLPHHDGVARACFAPDQKHVLTSGEDFLALLWELNSSQKPKKLPHRHQVHDGCFDPSGSRILTVSRDQTARLWDAESGEPLGPPFPHPSSLSHGVFLGGDSFLTFNSQGDSWAWHILSDGSRIEDLARLAQVLNGRVETDTGELSPQALVAAWRELKEKLPQHFTISRERILAWHQQQGELALAEDQLSAASFHFDHFLELEPHNEAVLQQRTTALTRLASEKPPSDK